jgi:uncharacterized membrane protein YdjX (TVP38/TMEM64 family)
MQSWGHEAAAVPAGRRVIRPQNVALAGRAAVIITIIAIAAYFAAGDRPFGINISGQSVAAWIGSLGSIGGLGIIVLMIAHSVIPFPVEIVTCIAGASFGLYWGTLFVWTGAMIGASVAFAIARHCGRSAMAAIISPPAHKRLDAWTATRGAKTLLVVRLIPVISFNLVNYAAGLTDVRWWTFLWTTGIGILPLTIFLVYLGENMRAVSWTNWIVLLPCAVIIWAATRMVKSRRDRSAEKVVALPHSSVRG